MCVHQYDWSHGKSIAKLLFQQAAKATNLPLSPVLLSCHPVKKPGNLQTKKPPSIRSFRFFFLFFFFSLPSLFSPGRATFPEYISHLKGRYFRAAATRKREKNKKKKKKKKKKKRSAREEKEKEKERETRDERRERERRKRERFSWTSRYRSTMVSSTEIEET